MVTIRAWHRHQSTGNRATQSNHYFIQAGVAYYCPEALHELRIQNQGIILPIISHQAKHELPREYLTSLPAETAHFLFHHGIKPMPWLAEKESIYSYWVTYRLNPSESCASRKNKSSSVRSESRRIGALKPRSKEGIGRSAMSANTNSSSFCSGKRKS